MWQQLVFPSVRHGKLKNILTFMELKKDIYFHEHHGKHTGILFIFWLTKHSVGYSCTAFQQIIEDLVKTCLLAAVTN